jgi:hypothetical protein
MSIPGMSAMGMSPGISMLATAVIAECPIAGITHAKPLPTQTRWARSSVMTSAVARRKRGIVLNI